MSFLKAALWWNKISLAGYVLWGISFFVASPEIAKDLYTIGVLLLVVTTGGLDTWGTYTRAKKCLEGGKRRELERVLNEGHGAYCSIVGTKAALREYDDAKMQGAG